MGKHTHKLDEQTAKALGEILANSVLDEITMKGVKSQLKERGFDVEDKAKKKAITAYVDAYLSKMDQKEEVCRDIAMFGAPCEGICCDVTA